MIDGDTVVAEGLWQLLGSRVRIESSRYPAEPAVGVLVHVGAGGPDVFGIAGLHAAVEMRPGITRCVPIAHVACYAPEPA